MQPIIPYFERIVFEIGGLELHGFGILVASGFLLGSALSQRRARRDGLDPEMINRLLGWLVAGVFIGGHLGHALFYEPKEYFANPIEFLKVWQGLSSFGGFLACAILSWYFFRKNKVPFWPYADLVAYGLMLGWFMGRMGCTAAHDHPGRITEFWLGVPGMCPGASSPAIACHDLGFYEAIFSLSVAFLFIWLDRKPRHLGFYVGWMITLYAPARFIMDFARGDPAVDGPQYADHRYFGLTPAQYGCFVFLALGAWILITKRNTRPVRLDRVAS